MHISFCHNNKDTTGHGAIMKEGGRERESRKSALQLQRWSLMIWRSSSCGQPRREWPSNVKWLEINVEWTEDFTLRTTTTLTTKKRSELTQSSMNTNKRKRALHRKRSDGVIDVKVCFFFLFSSGFPLGWTKKEEKHNLKLFNLNRCHRFIARRRQFHWKAAVINFKIWKYTK